MSRTIPTEESLGLSPTEEELNSVVNIGNEPEDDDIPLSDDPAPEPGKAAQEQSDPEGEKPKEEPKTVDLRALQEARNEAREARQSNRILEQRMNDMLAMMQRGNPPATEAKQPEVPRWDQDPLKAGQWTQEQLLAMVQKQEEDRQQAEQRQRDEQAYQAIQSRVAAEYEAESKADPTLPQMYDKLRESMGKELLALGYTQQQAIEHLNQTERGYVQYAYQTGIPVADLIRNVATARGIVIQPQAPAGKPAVDPKAIADAQQRHMSLSDAPGGEAPPALDAKALARMSDKEFNAWLSKKGNEAKFEEIMGKV